MEQSTIIEELEKLAKKVMVAEEMHESEAQIMLMRMAELIITLNLGSEGTENERA